MLEADKRCNSEVEKEEEKGEDSGQWKGGGGGQIFALRRSVEREKQVGGRPSRRVHGSLSVLDSGARVVRFP